MTPGHQITQRHDNQAVCLVKLRNSLILFYRSVRNKIRVDKE